MATQVQFRGGTTSEHSSFNGVAKEVTVDTTKQTLVVQDGSTNGGFPLMRENGTQSLVTTGDITSGNLFVPDSKQIRVGNTLGDPDFKIYHSSSNYLQADNGNIIFWADGVGKTALLNSTTGACELHYGGGTTAKLATTSQGINLEGNGTDHHILDLHNTGSGKGSQIKFRNDHEGGAYIGLTGDTTGDLRVYTEKTFKVVHGSDTAITSTADGAVQLYNDDVLHFTTHSLGVKVLGATGGTAQIDIQPDQGSDNADKWKIGAEDDGHFFISNKDSGAWDKSIAANRSGNVELYYDGGTAKFETTSTGAKVTGNLGVGTTPDTEFHVKGGGTVAKFEGTGGSSWISLYDSDDSTQVFVGSDGGTFKIQTSGSSWSDKFTIDTVGDATFAGNINPGSNNSKNIGDGSNNFASVWASTRFRGGDGVSLNLGGSQDFIIRHVDGTGNLIESPTGADLHIKMMGNSMDVADQTSATFVEDGAVKLYYDGSASHKFETKSNGARVTGTLEAYADSTSAASAGVFYNNNSAAGADCRVQIKTYSNQGADPYIHFDAGGSNFIVGEKWEGTTNNQLLIGPGDSPSTGTTGFRMNASGKVGLNSDPSNFRLKVVDTAHSPIESYTNNGGYYGLTCQSSTSATTQYYWQGIRSDGNQDGYIVSASAGTVALTNTSDYRLKDNIVSMTNGIDIIKKLNPVTYKWSASSGRDTTNTMQGFLAHEVDEAGVIGAVDGAKDAVWDTTENPVSAAIGDPKYQGLSLERLVPSLTAALKEAIAKIETLETKVAALESS